MSSQYAAPSSSASASSAVYRAVAGVPLVVAGLGGLSASPGIAAAGAAGAAGAAAGSLPRPVSPRLEYLPVPETVDHLCNYDFQLERYIVEAADRRRKEQLVQAAAAEERRQRVAERKRAAAVRREEAAAEKLKNLAPGLSADGRLLKPTAAESPVPDQQPTGRPSATATDSNTIDNEGHGDQRRKLQKFSYLEFEQGLPPPDPWDTPATLDEDLKTLEAAMRVDTSVGADASSRSRSPSLLKAAYGFHIPGSSSGPQPPPVPPSPAAFRSSAATPQRQPEPPATLCTSPEYVSSGIAGLGLQGFSAHGGRYPLSGAGAEIGRVTSYPSSSTPVVNAAALAAFPTPQPLPPKPPKNFELLPPSAAFQTHPVVSPPPAPAAPIPPRPPVTGKHEPILELMNMGFSRQQAVAALEKKSYNLELALNYLLDGQ